MVRTMRTILAMAASGLGLLAGVVSIAGGQGDFAPFFFALSGFAGIIAWLIGPGARPPRARMIAKGLAVLWAIVAIWIGLLLLWWQASCACSYPEPIGPPPNVAGIPTTVFQLTATYLGGALVVVAAFSRRLGPRGEARPDERR